MTKVVCMAVLVATIASHPYASAVTSKSVLNHNPARPKDCGINATLPAELASGDQVEFQPCNGSYKSAAGAVFYFAPSGFGAYDPNWIDRIPALRIKRIPVNEAIRSDFGRRLPITPRAPDDCGFIAYTKISKISGRNWRGWLAEDFYKTKKGNAGASDYCRMYLSDFRCVRMLIGNLKSSATLNQYCLPDKSGQFDLDRGITFEIFRKILNSLEFVEQ
ncbi:hypothetical protein [Cupriavidus necator]|uniref:hypothetical protein n=1 Tax=Cupriavidus necator TaxID=106590 RepID=UPI00140F9C73|nr:hypothetical protein [Cupriavidus necator]